MQASYGDRHWTPPKGHVDKGETEWQAAIRETHEEAGITEADVDIIRDFPVVLQYQTKSQERGIEEKEVTYWPARLNDPDHQIKLSHEHVEWRWLPLEEACRLAHYKDMQEALQRCEKKIASIIV